MEQLRYDWRFCGQITYGRKSRPPKITEEDRKRARRMRAIEIIEEARKLGEELMDVWDDE